mgnify:CR=1 FL=1
MIFNMYSVRDSKAEAFMVPFTMHNDGVAIRAFADMVRDENHAFSKNPEDYDLYYIGEFDDELAAIYQKIDNEEPVKLIYKGTAVPEK